MKKAFILLALVIIVTLKSFSQNAGSSTYNLKYIPAVSAGLKMSVFNDYGQIKFYSLKPITLSGTTPTWDINQSLNAVITLTGNTVLTLTNVVDGLTGNIKVFNPSLTYTLTIATNYPNDIIGVVRVSSNQLKVNSAKNSFSWWFVGGYNTWNGGNNYN